ncbi:neprilysin-1-like [Ornithodoros turicata]|uniref:neprilysin-1-like n=1 Tax=Ornithodoros turicata TaxID=34597 RepID=UPI003139282F
MSAENDAHDPAQAGEEDQPARVSQLLRCPKTIVAIVVLISLLISTAIAIKPSSPKVAYVKAHPACKSTECSALSTAITSTVNSNISPCQNFYRFVCDGWIKSHQTREGELRRLIFQEFNDEVANLQKKSLISIQVPVRGQDSFQKLAYVYQSCVRVEKADQDGIRVFREFMGFIGLEWPQVSRTRSFNVLDAAVRLSFQWDVPTLLYVTVKPSPYDRTRLLVAIDRGTSTVGSGKKSPALRKYISSVADVLNENAHVEKIEAGVTLAEKYLKDQISAVRKSVRKRSIDFKRVVSFRELEALTFVDDSTYWLDAVNSHMPAGHKMTPSDPILLEHPEHVIAVSRLIRKPEMLQSLLYYLGWLLVQALGPKAAMAIRKAKFAYEKASSKTGGEMGELNLWRVCMKESEDLMPTVYSALYVHGHASEKPKFDVKAIVDHVLWVTTETVRRVRWIDDRTKAKALTKVKKMRGLIAFPQWMRNTSVVKGLDSEIPDLSEHYLASWLRVKEIKGTRVRRTIKDVHSDDQTYHYKISDTCIRYFTDENRLIVHPAVLTVPLYAYGAPVAINYGSLGTLIAREVLSAFDLKGCDYDEMGNEDHWCSSEYREEYRHSLSCYSDQFDEASARVPGLSAANDTWTRAQLVADTEGLRQSYRAYRLLVKNLGGDRYDEALSGVSYTPEQLFFINRGMLFCANMNMRLLRERNREDMLAAHEYRCNIPLTNMREFTKAFRCKPLDLMYAKNKCAIW